MVFGITNWMDSDVSTEIGPTRGEAGLADGDILGFLLLERDVYETAK